VDAKKIGLAVAGVVAAGVIAAGGAAVANSTSSSSTTASSAGSAQNGALGQAPGATGQNGIGTPPGGQSGPSGSARGNGGMPGGGMGAEVTGDVATKVKAAVAAKDSSLTVDHVLKLTDGSYLALAMKSNAPVMYAVSSDLGTVTLQQAPTGGLGGAAPPTTSNQNGATA
jgi:hypothetical protein